MSVFISAGKAQRRKKKAERAALREAVARGELDLEMGDLTPAVTEKPILRAASIEAAEGMQH